MRKIDKNYNLLLSTKYKRWVDKLEENGTKHPESRTYYDDVVMELYKFQLGVCAYTERYICPEELYEENKWVDGKYITNINDEYKRVDHAGEMDHFDPELKENQYWLWDNLFMTDSTINSRKNNKKPLAFLKPDLPDYAPEKYFDYDEETHRFIPNTDIGDENLSKEIQRMIDHVLFLNHGVVRKDRESFINDIKLKQKYHLPFKIDRFFTAVNWCIDVI